MIKNLGVCDTVDWDSIIAQCASVEPEFIGPSHKVAQQDGICLFRASSLIKA